jgi:hypothetical protein
MEKWYGGSLRPDTVGGVSTDPPSLRHRTVAALRRWALPLGAVLAAAGGVAIWLLARDEKNGPAVQAVTSYVLVIVTAVYVFFTYGLVQNQRRQARYELETRALIELARILHQARRFMAPSLSSLFPLPGRGPKPDFERLARPDKQLLDLYWDLNRLTPDLPSEIRQSADDTWRAVWAASSDTINILWAFGREEEVADAENRAWTWEGAARFYREEHEVGRQRDPGYWYEMIRGVRVEAAVAALEALEGAVERLRSS